VTRVTRVKVRRLNPSSFLQIGWMAEGEVMSDRNTLDPRVRLVRQKYFSLRPKPLERWLWAQRVPPAAERVFWLHWQEGLQRGDWCSELPLRRVARECCLDVSTVTKAYQLLDRLGCIRRTDPGRDPANPFQQATAVTEVRLPRELLLELDRHPNRRTQLAPKSPESVHEGLVSPSTPGSPIAAVKPSDPFAGLRGRERVRALAQLNHSMSAAEQIRYREAARSCLAQMSFDSDSKLSLEDQGRVLQVLSALARGARPTATVTPAAAAYTSAASRPRRLSMFELARLRREIQAATCSASAPELLRQAIWSIEEGPLRRFSSLHALNIALKKIRESAWTRPNRMPPNWARAISCPADLETCRHA
jgi:hypothetical protein